MHIATNAWFVVLASRELPPDRAVGARRMGLPLVFWRDAAGAPRAAVDACPHRGAAFAGSRVEQGALVCPFHGHRFAEDGHCTAVPAHPDRPISAAMRLATVPVREAHGFVWLWSGPEAAPEADPDMFAFPGCSAAGSLSSMDLPFHHTRAIENQLDFAHLPFVHRRTIGRFVPSPAVDLEVSEEDGRLSVKNADQEGVLEFWPPGIWRLRTGRSWQFLAFVPVDETTSRVYIQAPQPHVTTPGLAHLVGWISRWSNALVLGEDKAVVATQPNVETRLRMGEVLLPSDAAIIAYRRWREARRAPFALTPPKAAQLGPA